MTPDLAHLKSVSEITVWPTLKPSHRDEAKCELEFPEFSARHFKPEQALDGGNWVPHCLYSLAEPVIPG